MSVVILRGHLRGKVDQTGLVERASRGDHDAFGMLIGVHLFATGHGSPADPP